MDRNGPPCPSAATVIWTARAEGAAEAGTTPGSGRASCTPPPIQTRTAWTPGSSRRMGRRGRPPTLALNGGLDTRPELAHQLGSLVGAPSPAPVRSTGPKNPAPRTPPLREPGAWPPSGAVRRPAGSRSAVPRVCSTPARERRAVQCSQVPPAPSRSRCDARPGPHLAAAGVPEPVRPWPPPPRGRQSPARGDTHFPPPPPSAPRAPSSPRGAAASGSVKGGGVASRTTHVGPAPPRPAGQRGSGGAAAAGTAAGPPRRSRRAGSLPPTAAQTASGEVGNNVGRRPRGAPHPSRVTITF